MVLRILRINCDECFWSWTVVRDDVHFQVCASHGYRDDGSDTYGVLVSELKKEFPQGCCEFERFLDFVE